MRLALISLASGLALLGTAIAIAGAAFKIGPVLKYAALHPFLALICLVVLGVVIAVATGWLRRVGGIWTEVGALLNDGTVFPARLTTYSRGSGKSKTHHAQLVPAEGGATRRFDLGILSPWWLTLRDDQTVYVHSRSNNGACLIEFEDGLLAMLSE